MIKNYIKGDIVALFSKGNNIAHGCNCFHTMGAGVAGQLAKAFPKILEADKLQTEFGDESKLGSYSVYEKYFKTHKAYCFNLYTQFEPGPNFEYSALMNCIIELNKFGKNKIAKPVIYMPRIGAGIGGGNWDIIEEILDTYSTKLEIVIVDWEPLL